MNKPTDQKRKKIVHDFANWTALSALRSGSPLKRAERIYDLIENHADLPVLFDPTRATDQTEFDRWHEKTVRAFCKAESELPVGWAAKIINVYLKARVYLAREGRKDLVSVIHPPIDYGLQQGLKKNFPHRPWKIRRIKDFRSYQNDYFPLHSGMSLSCQGRRVSPDRTRILLAREQAMTRPLTSTLRNRTTTDCFPPQTDHAQRNSAGPLRNATALSVA
jgi:hypothetical protein